MIKDKLKSNPVLRAPDFNKSFQMHVDANDIGIAAVLMQEDENSDLHPVSFYSKKLNKFQKSYSTIEKEALALVSAVLHFEIYITNSRNPTVVYTDHNPLSFKPNEE